MRIRTLLLALAVLLAAVPPQAFAFIPENPRQGVAPISATFGPDLAQREAGSHLGFPLRFLEILVRNGFRWTDPTGEVIALDDAAAIVVISALSGMTVAYLNSPAGQAVIADFKSFIGRQCQSAQLTFDTIVLSWDAFVQFAKGERSWEKGRGDDPFWDLTVDQLKEIERTTNDPDVRERAKRIRKQKEKQTGQTGKK